jgi:hypothetical protein
LKNGSFCGMSVWGRKENCKYYSVLNEVLKRNNLTEFTNTARFLEDVQAMKQDFTDAGFKNIKMWY